MDATAIRAELDHPVVDADGHIIEYVPAIRDLLGDEAGGAVADRFAAMSKGTTALRASLDMDQRRAAGLARTGWWGVPARNTLDRATAMLPGLLYERLDEIGIDVAVLYPTVGLSVMAVDDPELRRGLARACNRYYAEAYAPYADRLITVGVIPTYDPDEALDELDHATSLGLKGFLFGGLVLRNAPGSEGNRAARWVDGLGLDSAYDYDPVWRRCVELGVSPTFHSTGIGFGSRVSPTNYVANHIGNFAAGTEAVCRSLFFGGAMSRFPELRFAFLEGGVAWACNLLSDIVGHFEKRNIDALAHYDPRNLDRAKLDELVDRYAEGLIAERRDRLDETLGFLSDPDEDPAALDEWAQSGIGSVADIVRVFTEQCFFGCEADDPMNAMAFDSKINPDGSRLRAMFASDIGHWDVPDFTGVLPEAWELIEDGLVDRDEFRDFMFGNVVRLFGGTNPDFFAGTTVADEVSALLSPTA
jgi:predicted TIM-barrel fold metal-dependent hydrolase